MKCAVWRRLVVCFTKEAKEVCCMEEVSSMLCKEGELCAVWRKQAVYCTEQNNRVVSVHRRPTIY